MRKSKANLLAVGAIAAVAVLGVNYSSDATTPAPIRNVAKVETVTDSGGTGQVTYNVSIPGAGGYQVSLTANFYPQGTPSAPVTFSCALIRYGTNTALVAQDTSSSTYTSGFYVGVNAITTQKLIPSSGDTMQVVCGRADGGDWTWGNRPLSVTLTRLDAITTSGLPNASGIRHLQRAKGGASLVTTRGH